jgi:two-component system, cell cycle sensor histidine kinase and response regulator CckA
LLMSQPGTTIPPRIWKEADRLKAIEDFGILDSPREDDYDDVAQLLAQICEVPVSAVAIVAEGRQWFKAEVGMGTRETTLDISICKYAILQRGLFLVPDTTKDPRFCDNPLVIDEPHFRFYAGVPLISSEGFPIGTVCVLDYKPRVLTDQQTFALNVLSRQVMIQLELRRSLVARSKTDYQLRASELSYRRLFEAARDGIFILDIDTGRITDVNPYLSEFLGFSRDEMMGKTMGELSPFKDIEANEAMLKRLQEDGYVRYEDLPLKTSDGRALAVECVCNVYRVGDKKVIQCNIRDITVRKRNEARFRRLVDSNAQGIVFWKTNGEITGCNDAFLNIVGYSRNDQETGHLSWADMTPLDYSERDRLYLEKLSMGGMTAPYEKEYIRKDGSHVPVLIGAALFEDSPHEGVCFVVDLTEPKKLELQFLRAQRMESIGTLAGGIAHDLNNILTPIMISIYLLKEMSDDPKIGKILTTIETSAKRGADVVRQVLSFARGMEGEKIEVQPKHLLEDIESIIKNTFPKNIRLRVNIPTDIWTILGDPTQVHQILLNLCVNARDAMPNGGNLTITLTNCVWDEQYAAMNSGARAGSYVQLSVTDSGTGIPSAIIDKIFEPFFTTKELTQGTGLGLSTVMAIVKSHDGVIHVSSHPAKGTTFEVFLPAIDIPKNLQREHVGKIDTPRGKGETVLLVDDEASIISLANQTLQAFGYHVLTATDGAEAVAVYAEHRDKIAVVLTDMIMPIMDGRATIHALIRLNPAIKIIATSGVNLSESTTSGPGFGIKHFLLKPYTATTLLKTLRAVLDEA